MKFSLAIALLALTCTQAIAASLTGKVVRVADGDTVTVLDGTNTQHKIRLQGIDAPERKQPNVRKSGEYLASAVAGRIVVVEWHKRDRYGRVVGKVLLAGEDMNLRQVQAGLAWHYKKYAVEQSDMDRSLYSDAETDARNAGRGQWREPSPVPPWEWRRGQETIAITQVPPSEKDCPASCETVN